MVIFGKVRVFFYPFKVLPYFYGVRYYRAVSKINKKTDELLKIFAQNLNRVLDAADFPPAGSGRQIAVADTFHVSPTAARKWLLGLGMPELDHMMAICTRFNVTIDELLGRAPRPLGKSVSIPILNGEKEVSVVQFEADWLNKNMHINQAGVHMLVCNGDSMAPTINNGEIMFVDTPVSRLDDNSVYLLRYQNRILVRRIRVGFSDMAELICDNGGYQSANFPLGSISYNTSNEIHLDTEQPEDGLIILGKVLWSIKRI